MAAALTIGDFSRISRLSVKALRHYHQVGLLEPAEVDASTGYRSYALDQVPTAQVIRRLRDLDMPIDEVKAVLATPDPDGRNALIADHLARLEHRLSETAAAVGSLRDLLVQPEAPITVELRRVPATPAVGIREVVDREDLPTWWRGALGELAATVEAAGVVPTAPTGGVYADDLFQYGRGNATVFVPVADDVRIVGRVQPLEIPAAELAITRHDGSHRDIDVTYAALGTYVTEHALGVTGPVREHYLVDVRQDERTWQTEIGWPVFDTGARPPR